MKIIFGSRRDHHLAKASVFLIVAALIAGMAGCDGISAVEIRDWYDLDDVSNNLGGSYILMNDLDSTTAGYEELAGPTANGGKGWQPLGFMGGTASFTGTFDGQGYEIRDLFINRPDQVRIGLFGMIDIGGFVKNLGVVDVDVTGDTPVGGLAGYNWATISNSYSTGSVTGNTEVGGLVGVCYGTVTNSYSAGSVTGEENVGGLVGTNNGAVSNSYSSGSVAGHSSVGGLVGFLFDPEVQGMGTVSNSYSTASVAGDAYVGGLVGQNYGYGIVSNSYYDGNVTGNWYVGGLVGQHHRGIMSNSYYNYDEVLVNGVNVITIGALFGEDFEEWLANGKFLDVSERLTQEDDYYAINDVSDFKQLLAFGQDSSLKFRLMNDLDLATEPGLYIPYLAGELDGYRHKISNFNFHFDFLYEVGLFGYLAYGGSLHDVAAENVSITAFGDVGGLVGCNYGTVSVSYSTGSVTGDNNVGGLVGYSWSHVINCYSTASVTGNNNVGGLVGETNSLVSNSYSSGNVTGTNNVGGLVGDNLHGRVTNCYSTASVTGNNNVGGLAGIADENYVHNSFWDTQTSGQGNSAGGTGKTTAEMQNITTFSGATWDITEVANPGTRNPAYIWNIADGLTYPFLSWQAA
jgi:hypothetical protein